MMYIFVLIVVFFVLFLFYFMRTPTRDIPKNTHIISPANGKIIAIDHIEDEHLSFFKEGVSNELEVSGVTLPAHVVVIQMNLKNVHVQRAPIEGTVTYIKHTRGRFKNAIYNKNKKTLADVNEKNLIIIKNKHESIGVIQVAGFLARRIKSYVHVGQKVTEGQKIGFIMFGSQVVLVIPKTRKLLVSVGDITIDGETVVAI